jgi:uncharacterized protein YkwD
VNRVVQLLTALAATLLLLTALAGTGAQAAATAPGPYELGVLSAMNKARAQYGLKPLHPSWSLNASARAHTWSMAEGGYFSHFSRDGTSAGARIRHYYGTHGYTVWYIGETIFWATPNATPQQLVNAWLASPEHRAIVLSPLYRQIGLGVVHMASAPGTFGGQPVTIVTADYGFRR